MTRRLRRGGAALLALALAGGLSACGGGSGFDAATRLIEADNAAGETPTDAIQARAIVFVKSANASAAALAGTLINRGDKQDVLTTVEIEPTRGAPKIALQPNLALAPGQVLALGTESHEPLTVQDGGALKVGHFAIVTLRFRTGGDIKLEVPVEVRENYYSSIVPATGPTTTQADRKIANACLSNNGKATTKASQACTEAARAAAKAAAAKTAGATGDAATTTQGGTAVTGKAGSAAVPSAKKSATRSGQSRTTTKTAPAATAPAAHDTTGHDTTGHGTTGHAH